MISIDSVLLLMEKGKYDFAFEELSQLTIVETGDTRALLKQNLLKADLFLKKKQLSDAQKTALAIINNQDIHLDEDLQIYLDAILILGEVYLLMYLADDGLKIIRQGKSILEQYYNVLPMETNSYRIKLSALEGVLSGFQGDYKKSCELLNLALIASKESNLSLITADILIKFGIIVRGMDQFDKSLSFFLESLTIYKNFGHFNGEAECYHQLGLTYQIRGDIQLALKEYHHSLIIRESLGNKLEIAWSLHRIGSCYKTDGNLDQALKYLLQSLQIRKELQNKETIAFSLSEIADIYWMGGHLELSLSYYYEALRIYTELNNITLIGVTLNQIGQIYCSRGELEQALASHYESFQLLSQTESKFGIAVALYNLGNDYFQRSELNLALKFTQQSLKIFQSTSGELSGEGNCYLLLGKISYQKGAVDALQYYQTGLDIFNKINHLQGQIETLFGIGLLLDDQKKYENAQEYHSQALFLLENNKNNFFMFNTLYRIILNILPINLETMTLYYDKLHSIYKDRWRNRRLGQRIRLLRALINKSRPRLKDKAIAQEILMNIINEPIIDYETTVIAIVNLFELCLKELYLTNDLAPLEEATKLSNELLEIAEKENLPLWLAEAHILRSQIALLNSDLIHAKNYLTIAQNIAETKGLKRLAVRISNEHDDLLEKEEQWQSFFQRNVSLKTRLELLNLEQFFDIKHLNDNIDDLTEEKPLFLMILTDAGVSLYSLYFVIYNDKMSDQLVAGFISAVNTLSRVVFHAVGSIERIKHHNYTALIKSVDNIMICYVYEGLTYLAQKKVESVFKTLTETDNLWNLLIECSNNNNIPTKNTLAQINVLVRNIFHVD